MQSSTDQHANAIDIDGLIEAFESGSIDREALKQALAGAQRAHQFEDLDWVKIDHDRATRQGHREVIFAEGKTVEQLLTLLDRYREAPALLCTRTTDVQRDAAATRFKTLFHIDPIAQTIAQYPAAHPDAPTVIVLSAGTSDQKVSLEAIHTLRFLGLKHRLIQDVGVAGIRRLLNPETLTALYQANAIIVVAGMEGALASVVGGLVACPVYAVPTSVGYGAHFDGLAALLSMLNSCSSGISVVNIDNGFGAAMAAFRALRVATS